MFFSAAVADTVPRWLHAIFSGAVAPKRLTRLRIELNGKQVGHPALNDALVCHPHPVVTTRVAMKPPSARTYEEQKNSGVWISTPAGSSSAARAAGGKLLPLYSNKLQYVVREPYIAGDRPPYRFVRGVFSGGSSPESLYQNGVCVGSPDEVIRTVQRFEQIGLDQLVVIPVFGWDIPHEKTLASVRVFGEKVLPHFQRKS